MQPTRRGTWVQRGILYAQFVKQVHDQVRYILRFFQTHRSFPRDIFFLFHECSRSSCCTQATSPPCWQSISIPCCIRPIGELNNLYFASPVRAAILSPSHHTVHSR